MLPCPKTQEHQSTCVDSWVHRVPENGHQPLGRGYSLRRSACRILWSNPFLLRYFTEIAPSGSLALRLRNTKVPVWTHESIGYPKMDISHWDAAIHYGVQLAQYCDQTRSFNAISRRSPPVYSLALRLRNTKVPVWTHESIGYPKMDISHWDAAIHYGVQLAQYCDQTLSCYAISQDCPLWTLALSRVPMADVHFRVPYGLMSGHRYFGTFLILGQGSSAWAILWNSVTPFDHNIGQAVPP